MKIVVDGLYHYVTFKGSKAIKLTTDRQDAGDQKPKLSMNPTIEQISNRAEQLTASMSHGQACFAACRELAVSEDEVASTASIVSAVLTNREMNIPVSPEMVLNWKKAESDRKAQMDFVSKWACAVGKTGSKGKQSRQGHLRKLAKHGLKSEYAFKMAAQAGIPLE